MRLISFSDPKPLDLHPRSEAKDPRMCGKNDPINKNFPDCVWRYGNIQTESCQKRNTKEYSHLNQSSACFDDPDAPCNCLVAQAPMVALCSLVLQEPHDPQGDPQGGHQDVLQVFQVHFQVDQPEQFQVAACRSSPGTSCALPRLQRAAVRTQGVGWRVCGRGGSWLPYSTYLYLYFHLLSRRWLLHTGGSKIFKPLFCAGMSVFDQFFCRISMSPEWMSVRSQKQSQRREKHTKKTFFLKYFSKWASP